MRGPAGWEHLLTQTMCHNFKNNKKYSINPSSCCGLFTTFCLPLRSADKSIRPAAAQAEGEPVSWLGASIAKVQHEASAGHRRLYYAKVDQQISEGRSGQQHLAVSLASVRFRALMGGLQVDLCADAEGCWEGQTLLCQKKDAAPDCGLCWIKSVHCTQIWRQWEPGDTRYTV